MIEHFEAIPLCRIHHTEIHTLGKKTWMKKYDSVNLYKVLCKLLINYLWELENDRR
jgi:hypothetical protein